jgi:uncharacterized damage-inducible protein DinB
MLGTVSFFMLSLAETFLLNNRVNVLLLNSLTTDQLAHVPTPKARSIADQIAHLHKVRIMWLEARDPERAKALQNIPAGTTAKSVLRSALEASAEALAAVLTESVDAGKMKGFKRGPIAFCGYMMAHEAHHRGQILVHLKHAKMPVNRDIAYALWQWEKL